VDEVNYPHPFPFESEERNGYRGCGVGILNEKLKIIPTAERRQIGIRTEKNQWLKFGCA